MRSYLALLVVLLSLFVTGTTVVAGDAHSHSVSGNGVIEDRTTVNETQTNGTTIRIRPRPNGDAYWNISMEFALDSENETAAFKRMGRDFENGNGGALGFSANTFRKIAEREQKATGRQMKIRNVNPEYSVSNHTGTLTLTFIWTNFSRVNGGKIHFGDAFVFNDGKSTWLRSLSANQRLVIESPKGYQIHNSNKPHYNGSITIEGPKTLWPQTNNSPIDVTYNRSTSPPERSFPVKYIAAFLVLVGILGASVYAFLQRGDDEPTATADVAEQRPNPGPGPVPDSEPEDDESDLELLSDEERVEHLLKQNGGRMKQATIVKETNWSNAKVSQLLSAMNEADRINKLRIGRENLITLPGEDITDFDTE